jgi:hypothetical protein
MIMYNVSSQLPWLLNGDNWNNNHVANRVHISQAGTTATCGGPENISFGWVHGVGPSPYGYGSTVWNNRYMTEYFTSYGCGIIDTGVTPAGPGNLTLRIDRNTSGSFWTLSIWLGYWYVVAQYATNWGSFNTVDATYEIASWTNLANIVSPVNLMHKIQIYDVGGALKPWHNYALQPSYQGLSYCVGQSPLVAMDCHSAMWSDTAAHYLH